MTDSNKDNKIFQKYIEEMKNEKFSNKKFNKKHIKLLKIIIKIYIIRKNIIFFNYKKRGGL